jgi:phage protein
MQELQVKITQAQVEIIDREKFEQNINEVVAKYQNYTVTASTIKDDKQVLANLRKLDKQVSDERIRNKKLLSEPADEFDKYIKQAIQPLKDIINKIDVDVKEFEAHQKMVRLDTVKAYISNKSAEYMIDPRVFDEKATEYIKASDFMADGMTLKKATMKSLDDMVTFEFQKQQELEKSKSAISGLCAEYGMTDSPYIRMLRDLTLAEVFEQIKADYAFQKQKQELERARQELEQASQPKSTETPKFDPETGEILEGGELSQNESNALREAENGSDDYSLKMGLTVFFKDLEEKERFKKALSDSGFEYGKNYWVKGFGWLVQPLKQDELADNLEAITVKKATERQV